jgi:hypothetical protein
VVVSDVLRSAGLSVQLYASVVPPADAPLLPDVLPADGAGSPDLLVHLPTCYYDADTFVDEVQASGRRALVLPAQFYDAPTDGLPRCPMVAPRVLAARLPAADLVRIDRLLGRLGELLTRHLGPFVPAAALLQRQVAALLEGFRHNALVFFTLEQALDTSFAEAAVAELGPYQRKP